MTLKTIACHLDTDPDELSAVLLGLATLALIILTLAL